MKMYKVFMENGYPTVCELKIIKSDKLGYYLDNYKIVPISSLNLFNKIDRTVYSLDLQQALNIFEQNLRLLF